MPPLIDQAMKSLPQIAQKIGAETQALHNLAPRLREYLLNEGYIKQFAPTPKHNTLAVIDGAMVVQQFQIGDLIQTGAVIAESPLAPPQLTTHEPSLFHQTLLPHTKESSNYANALMMLQEMLLTHTHNLSHDIRVIDGSWTPAIISVLLALTSSETSSQILTEYLITQANENNWDGDELNQVFTERLQPWTSNPNKTIVAISKSDTATKYATTIKHAYTQLNTPTNQQYPIPDRKLAYFVLQPGEYLTPNPSTSRLHESSALNQNQTRNPNSTWSALKYLHQNQDLTNPKTRKLYDTILNILNPTNTQQSALGNLRRIHQEQWLWTVFFKPTQTGTHARPIMVDYMHTPNQPNHEQYLNETLTRLNADISPGILELQTQHYSDLKAKEISTVAKITKQYLSANLTGLDSQQLIGQYRT